MIKSNQLNSIIEKSYKEKRPLNELAGVILNGLKAVGFSVAAYYIMQSIVKKIMMDKKFTDQLASQISAKMDVLQRKNMDRLLNPNVPKITKGYGTVLTPTDLYGDDWRTMRHGGGG